MKVRDKVKLIKGAPQGKTGIIIDTRSMATRIMVTENGEEKAEREAWYVCKAEDGTIFFGFQNELELIE